MDGPNREVREERIKCDCHGTQTMAVRRGDRIVIEAVHHGRKHVAVVVVGPQGATTSSTREAPPSAETT